MKTCPKCGETKPLEEFHKESRRKDGRTARCRSCINGYMRSRYTPAVREKQREYARARRYRLKASGEESGQDLNAYMREYRKRPGVRYRQRCRDRLNKRIQRYRDQYLHDRKLIRPTNFLYLGEHCSAHCEMCGESITAIHCHHFDYDRPFYFIAMCSSCHGKVHVGEITPPAPLLELAEMTERHMEEPASRRSRTAVEHVSTRRFNRAKSLEPLEHPACRA